MKKILGWLMVLCMAVGGSVGAYAVEGDLLARIQAKGEIVIATEGAWAPWTYHDEENKLVGFDVEVAQGIAAYLGVKATFVECEWDSIFAGLDAGRYDMAANGVEYTDVRAEKYDFSEPYGYIRTALIVRGDNEEIHSFTDLAGKKTANSIASTYMTLAESYGAQAAGVDTLDQTIDMVLSGRADATLNAEVSYYDYLRVHPDANLKVVALTEEASRVCIPMRKGDDTATLLAAVNEAIAALAEQGELARISEKYFGNDITQVQTEGAAGMMVSLQVGDKTFTATIADSETAQAFAATLPQTWTMRELNGNKKYVDLGQALPTAEENVEKIQTGDLMLYGDNCLVLFYDSFDTSYAYTRIGRVDDAAGLAEALGTGDTEITISK